VDPVLATLVRVGATYVFLLILVRVSGKRTIGEGTPFDVVVALVLGDFPDDLIWGEVPVAQGLVAMSTVMLAHLVVAYASYGSLRFDRLVGAGPTPLIRDGRTVRDALRRARMNDGDLDVALRHHGGMERGEVRQAQLEPTGEVSVLPLPAAGPARRRDLREDGAG
jgi:uncharacterized membrane protein YcaP (DUF421 family)